MTPRTEQVARLLGAAVALASLFLLGACSSISGAPPRITSANALEAEDPDYKQALERFYRQRNDAGRVRVRNQFVETRIAIIDNEYLKFRQSLYQRALPETCSVAVTPARACEVATDSVDRSRFRSLFDPSAPRAAGLCPLMRAVLTDLRS